jgi:hypothetical protein
MANSKQINYFLKRIETLFYERGIDEGLIITENLREELQDQYPEDFLMIDSDDEEKDEENIDG